ncbi:MAG: carbon starvation CstA family protein, partial [Chthoniobacterales bacterium]
VYVIIVFLDLTASGFVGTPEVATASGWFVLMALAFGRIIVGTRLPYWAAITIFVALTYAGLAVGHFFPAPALGKDTWVLIVLAYCFVAAILPVSVLMQPRDFLSATFLYAIMALGLVGALVTPETFELPFYAGFQSENLGMMVPFLFITVACGACSGFHSMVGSGTTSKQIRRESDVRRVAYGGMLVEGVLATFALGCIAVVGGMEGSAVDTFAGGAAVFFSALGVPSHVGVVFATLAVSTFLLTTLDTCTRLARFLVEEMFGWTGAVSRVLATFAIVGFCGLLATHSFTNLAGELVPAWKALWPLFGATNQLLAALALVTLTVFLRSRRVAVWFAALPAALMIAMPMAAMVTIAIDPVMEPLLRFASSAQLALGLFVVGMSLRYLIRTDRPAVA